MGRYAWFRVIRLLASFRRPVAYWFGDRGGELSGLFDRPKREAVYDNLRVILGPEATRSQIRRRAKQVLRQFGSYFAEFFGPRTFGRDFIFKHVRLVNANHLDRAIEGGTGAFIVGTHLSNWEIALPLFASRGYDATFVAQGHADPRVTELFRRMRAARGYAAIPTDGSFRQCVAVLGKGTSICFGGDRDIGVGGVEVRFFGRPTVLPSGPARIGLAAGAKVIPAFMIRSPNRDLTLTLEPAIEPPAEGDRRHKALVMTQKFADLAERYVRAFPTQWGAFFRVWNDRKPLGAAERVGYSGDV